MSAPRFFVAERCEPGIELALTSDDAHHASDVLRMKAGDPIVVIDAAGPWHARVTSIGKGVARVSVLASAEESTGELPAAVTVLQALAKGAKFDFALEKTVELGACRIVPVRCARSYTDATPVRLERWRRIARAAAQQSRRRMLPEVSESMDWPDALSAIGSAMPIVVAWERAPRGSLADAVQRCKSERAFAIAVGPEGSFSDAEIDVARAFKCTFVSLGPTIVRTETAATALLAAIAFGCGWW